MPVVFAIEHADRIRDEVRRHRYRFNKEIELQDGLAVVLTGMGQRAEREVRLGPGDIIDFLTPEGVGIEVKIGGGLADVTRQIHRYASHAAVKAILLITTRAIHSAIPPRINGKSVQVCTVGGGIL